MAREELQREKEALQRQIDFFEEKRKAEARAAEERGSPNYLRGTRDRSESPGPRYASPGAPALPDSISHKRSASDDLQSMRAGEEGSYMSPTGSEGRHPPQRTLSATAGSSTPPMRRESMPMPLHLLSRTNEQKLGPVPQQSLPLRLANQEKAKQLLPGKLVKKGGGASPSVSVSVSTAVVMSSSSYTLRTATINTATMAPSPSAVGSVTSPPPGAHTPHTTPRSHTQPVNMLPMKLASSSTESKKSKQRPRSASSVMSPTSPPLVPPGGSQSQDSSPSSASPVHSQPSSKRKEPQIIYF